LKAKYVCIAFSLALVLASCKSAPKEEAQTPAETPAAPAAQPVKEEPKPAEVQKPVEEKKDYTAQNQAGLEKIEKARKEAIDAGAPDILKDAFDATEKLYADKKAENQDKLAAADLSETINDIAARYEALAKAAQAYTAKQKIDELDLAQYDKADYDKGEQAAADIVGLYNSNASGKDLNAKAKEGNDAYTKVLITGLKKIAALARTDALAAKKKADSVYAAVSEKTAYAAAAEKITKADSSLVCNDPENAYKGYKSAAEDFNNLFTSVSQKREAAQKAMDEAKQKVADAAAYAAKADTDAPLGDEKVEGIEADDAVLLEKDTFANPEDAAIDVNNTADGKAAAEIESAAAAQNAAAENAAGGTTK